MDLTMFIIDCQNSVKTTKMSETPITPKIKPMMDWLDKLEKWLDEVPPVDQPMRFGNKAFRTWMDKIKASLDDDLVAIISTTNPEFTVAHKAVPELRVYLEESFGSYERIDYGTGHELNFFVFIYCMCKIGVYQVDDFKALINKVFQRYMALMRKLQIVYFLEPAGSHGVWGLDDYQHLAFLFGASQLINNPEGFDPNSIHEEGALAERDDYMYFGCIAFIKQVK
jgi:serine/threonine-protein phosphatase 2A activator